ncbi:MAG: hypothetical protein KGD63_00745, partial [Candidatus Lokiarchaeota archaeon]|nr:hypothetical protein [Candidatus Lokiarchaeota archaeon]
IKSEKRKELIKLYDYGKLKLENGQFTEETGNILKDVIKESEQYEFVDILHNAKKSLELYQEKVNLEKKEELTELFNLVEEKINNQQYSQDTIDSLNKILKESEQYNYLDLNENIKKRLMDIQEKKNQGELKETE